MPYIDKIYGKYSQEEFDTPNLCDSPLDQFAFWLNQSVEATRYRQGPASLGSNENGDVAYPYIMVLSTLRPDGCPTSRVVLLKEINQHGFIFLCSYNSAKSRELEANPVASLLFFWRGLKRQVRVEGKVTRISEIMSDSEKLLDGWFRDLAINKRISTWASPESQVIPSRQWLVESFEHYHTQLGNDPARPDHYGGWCLSPDRVEFDQFRSSCVHDRIVYIKSSDEVTGWQRQRLAG